MTDSIFEKEKAVLESAKVRDSYKGLLKTLSDSFPFFIPETIMHEMLEGNFYRARGIFEQASLVDFSAYPLALSGKEKHLVLKSARPDATKAEKPQYGSAAYGFKSLK